ncbi:MAG: FAD:protein FMN transferase [Planctomycetaceae bacterium]|nr:FAD:protein FMN transferase [Planctomycetaceae bacterium]
MPWDLIRFILAVILITALFGWYALFPTQTVHSDRKAEGKTMGTHYTVKVFQFPITVSANSPADNDKVNAPWKKLAEEIQNEFDRIDNLMSTYKSDSEVGRFNRSESAEWFEVSPETAEVIALALEIAELSSGAFDITVAPLVDIWGFGPGIPAVGLEELKAKTEEAKSKTGYANLEVRRGSSSQKPAIKKALPELTIDLSGIAKGYAADAVGKLLEKKKLTNYMVEVGGEVRCSGNKGTMGEWNIGIEKPLLTEEKNEFTGLQRELPLKNMSLATSGGSHNYRIIDGKYFSHTIDPRTGFPVELFSETEGKPDFNIGSVSVLDRACARADALATAFIVLGEKEGLALAEKEKIPVLYLLRSKDNSITERASSYFPK